MGRAVPPRSHPCCAPSKSLRALPTRRSPLVRGSEADLVSIDGGMYRVGTDDGWGHPSDGEGPEVEVEVARFGISATAATNGEFARFIDATGHVTEAERAGWSFVFHSLVDRALIGVADRVVGAPWWCRIEGADWRRPHGPGSSVSGLEDHPVVHVSWYDAEAFASWNGARLPTEAEWEVAARGGLSGARYPWGDQLHPDGRTMCNIFEGDFPHQPSPQAEYVATAPVTAYPANGKGLHNTVGNVWEWTADWFWRDRRKGPEVAMSGLEVSPGRVIKGGSYLCHDSYCNRYRVAARSWNSPDSTTGNTGFRIAGDL